MLKESEILSVLEMLENENLDVRTVTLGISLLDCASDDIGRFTDRIHTKITRLAAKLVSTCDQVGEKYGIPVVNKRIAVTPMADVGAGLGRGDFVKLAKALDAAATEMARYYGLPAESTGFGTDQHVPSLQAGYERALNGMLPVLSWPDILVGPGLLGGAMILSFEQLLIDVEVFRMCKRAHEGIATDEDKWLEDVISAVGPGGSFISERSTVKGIRGGEWYLGDLGTHTAFEAWEASGRPQLLAEVRDRVDQILADHQPLPLGEDVERELARLQQRAAAEG